MNSTAQPTATTPLVLVVEDEPAIASILTAYLERDGLRSRMASDGQEALQLFRLLRPDLVLLDIHLPGMDGLSVVREMKTDERTNRIPILALTAHAMRGDKDRFLEAGCDGYISKPIDVKTFLSSIEQFMKP